ncbi:3,4-dihydroxy 2-butanone 4-phosphate synthase [Thecaphora frezii]
MFDHPSEAIAAIARGEFVVVLDDEHRENEGDLIIAASECTTEKMAWFIRHTSGFICISLTPERIEELEIPMMVPRNNEKNKTAYTVTVDYKWGTTTGISAHDRALTSRMLAQSADVRVKDSKPDENEAERRVTKDDFTRPGHLCPLRYTEGGVRVRMGHTEASVDLCKAAKLPPAGLLCELVDPDDPLGGIASRDACLKFAKQHNLRITTIELLKKYREEREGPLPQELRDGLTSQQDEDRFRGVEAQQQEVAGPKA